MGLRRHLSYGLATRVIHPRYGLLIYFRFTAWVNHLFLKIGFCLQRRNGEDIPVAQTKNINHRRFAASFRLQEVTKTDQDLYRCVTQSERGSGVSNFAQLIVRGNAFCSMPLFRLCESMDTAIGLNHSNLPCTPALHIIINIPAMSCKVDVFT